MTKFLNLRKRVQFFFNAFELSENQFFLVLIDRIAVKLGDTIVSGMIEQLERGFPLGSLREKH